MAQSLVVEAIVLSTLRYGDSSRIARLATRELGVQSVMAKGALRPRSRFGAALQPLSMGTATILPSARTELHLLTAFDLAHLPAGLSRSMPAYAAAQALAETMLAMAPAAPQEESFEGFKRALLELELAGPDEVEAIALHWLWSLQGLLGFAPALDQCVLDGQIIAPTGALAFSASEGGALCAACARSHAVSWLAEPDRADLVRLLAGTDDLPVLDQDHAAAHRRLVVRYLRHRLGGDAELPAVEFWRRRAWEAA